MFWRVSQPLSLFFELLLFSILLLPSIIVAGIQNILPPKRKEVKGQVILITGAARGIGRQLAINFHKLGAKIACVDINEQGNSETARIINEDGGIARSYTADVSCKDQIKILHESVREDLGPVDMVINNAAIVQGHSYLNPNKDELIEKQLKVNLLSHFWMNREVLPSMLARNKGHIVAISSMASLVEEPGLSVYSATKCAINGSMGCLNNELKMLNSAVVTSTVLPYFVQTNEEISKNIITRIPEIPIKTACESIVNGILENRRIFSVPKCLYLTRSLVRLLPDNLQLMLMNIFYTKVIPKKNDLKVIQKYCQNKE